jgi:peptide deformylase
MIPIVTGPNEVLAQKAKPVEKVDSAIQKFVEEMKMTLDNTRDPEGVGLAAPQVGKSVQIFIVKPSKTSKHEVYINPKITLMGEIAKIPRDKQGTKLEGCLSLPTIWGPVLRAPKVKISFLDENGKKHTQTVSGFKAVILQHEFDHLQGILFPRRVLEQQGKLYKSSKNEKNEDVFEEIEL